MVGKVMRTRIVNAVFASERRSGAMIHDEHIIPKKLRPFPFSQ